MSSGPFPSMVILGVLCESSATSAVKNARQIGW
jgi:hypothetical protein